MLRKRSRELWSPDEIVAGPGNVDGVVVADPGNCVDAATDEAAQAFVEHLMAMKNSNAAVSAKSMCIACYWAGKFGAPESIVKLGFRPGASSGHYQRHLDFVMGTRPSEQNLCTIPVPMYSKHELKRSIVDMPVLVPHEIIDEDLRSNASYAVQLSTAIEKNELPPSYHEHPVVRDATPGTLVAPYGLFVDGVGFSKTDGFIGFWIVDIVCRVHTLVAALRKRWLCRCGCKGWCSVFAVLDFLRWSFTCASAAINPATKWNGDPWPPGSIGFKLANAAMKFKVAITRLKGDWMEWATTFGLSSWSSVLYACCLCHCDLESMHDGYIAGDPSTFASITPLDYEEACTRCEQIRWIASEQQHASLRAVLKFDEKKKGRVLDRDLPELELLAGDRLEATSEHPDILGYDRCESYPVRFVFWRRCLETFVRRRNPLFSIPGVTILLLCVDILHCIYLGIAQHYVVHVFWTLIESNVYGAGGASNDFIAVLRLKIDLWNWYRSVKSHGYTEIQELTLSMLGKRSSHARQPFKGAQCKALVFFCVHILRKYAIDGTRDLLQAGEHLANLITLIKKSGAQPDAQEAALMRAHGIRHLAASQRAGVCRVPKHHQMLHLLDAVPFHGNPNTYDNFWDESLNRVAARIAAGSYSAVWTTRMLTTVKQTMRRTPLCLSHDR